MLHVAPAVAKAAMDTGVASKAFIEWDVYKIELMKRMGLYNKLVRDVCAKAKIAVKMMNELGQCEVIEPILLGIHMIPKYTTRFEAGVYTLVLKGAYLFFIAGLQE